MRLQNLQRSQNNPFIKWISINYLPMVESWQTKSLAYCMNSQISLKAQSLDTRNQGSNNIVRCSNFWDIILYWASPFSKYSKYSLNTLFSSALDFSEVKWFHHFRTSCQKGWVKCSTGCRNDLTWRAFDWIFGDVSLNHSKFNISHWLIAKRSFPSTPSKSLNYTLSDSIEILLVSVHTD